MLSKRTNILFTDEVFNHLTALASRSKTSVGDLVRKAVIKVYYQEHSDKRVNAYNKILFLRKNMKKISNKEIKELINYGRKY